MTTGLNGVKGTANLYKRGNQSFTIEDVCVYHKNLLMKPDMVSVAR